MTALNGPKESPKVPVFWKSQETPVGSQPAPLIIIIAIQVRIATIAPRLNRPDSSILVKVQGFQLIGAKGSILQDVLIVEPVAVNNVVVIDPADCHDWPPGF
jgi:hypothetical protein